MINLASFFGRWTGQGGFAITVPPMDGPLRPNSRLDAFASLARVPDVDNLACIGDLLYLSSQNTLLVIDGADVPPRSIDQFSSNIVSMAVSKGGLLAIGLDDGTLLVRAPDGTKTQLPALASTGRCRSPTALLFAADDAHLMVAVGSADNPVSQWKRDLMQLNRTGSVWKLDLTGGQQQQLVGGLGYPCGLAFDAIGRLVISEAWTHSLIVIEDHKKQVVMEDLPGYPGRLLAAAGGGFWLTVFAPRSQMVEFVLRERVFCDRMIQKIEPEHWMCPTLRARASFLEPLQGGAVKHLGIDKPWSPTRSYGLLIKLDNSFHPTFSLHSRADGRRHGVTSCAEQADRLVIACNGNDELLAMPLEGAGHG